MEKRAIFTTSLDDGHPVDTRIAELLSRHGFRGTFFMPLSNCGGLPVMLPEEPRRLWKRYLVTNTLFIPGAIRQLLRGPEKTDWI